MARSTGPILAMGAVTLANESVFHGQPVDWRVPVATGLLASAAALAEKAWPQGVVILAWTGLLTVLLTRTKPSVPSPTESLVDWFNAGQKK
jgi:hypothetical protein